MSKTGSISVNTENIFPIIKINCLQCHDAKNHFGGIVIENYTQIAESGKSGELYNSIQIFPCPAKPTTFPSSFKRLMR